MAELQQTVYHQAVNSPDEKPDRKKNLRNLVNLILPNSLMIGLAVIMVPLILIPIFFELTDSLMTFFRFLDYAILGIFIIEYLLKTILAADIIKHILNPWHLLDLAVIILPLIGLIPAISAKFGVSPLLLRLIRIARLIAVSSRAMDRKRQMNSTANNILKTPPPMELKVMDGSLDNIYDKLPVDKIGDYLRNPSHTWIDLSIVSDDDLDQLSNILGIPRILLESELVDESYPRVDHFERYSMIFARIADVKLLKQGSSHLSINRAGLLVICYGQNIITLSKSKNDIFKQILGKVKKIHTPGEPLVVSILYTLLRYVLEKDKQIIAALEQELMSLESIPTKNRPSDFLETTFYLRKEVNQLVPSLLHLKEVIDIITSKRVPLEGFAERHEKIFDILLDEATYLHETASNARDNLLSLIDLYINTNSYEMNKVMRMVAVFTSLGIIPAVMGLFGSNILGNPWDVHLWQLFSGMGITMLIFIWVFLRLGWLKG